ncbi:hypothetical protein RZR97_04980 [Hydrogenimonas thermophila]|uniref:hypothetical protein n=1 Tax=Hydrogenimonas thermophila TaxID=223786 RepID=UPI0029370407|nr:hypothetical protein [Hydrogenimonas thermophila]WOE70928.1 hypothetical protein RZR91_05000 [Hydrogenimonas thermophila]WOE73446.1 hypothetical protein RZR97_04980 [Hydrogenimonas thermophila]
MSIKEQVEFVKEELTQDEKLLEGLIKVERFYKKNRLAILALSISVVIGGIGYGVMEYVKEQHLLKANSALIKLQSNSSDSSSLKILKEYNPSLYELYILKEATTNGDIKKLEELVNSKDETISDLAKYHVAIFKNSLSQIKDYRLKSTSLLKDLALFDEAYLLLKSGKVDEAKSRLAQIQETSSVKPVAKMLEHYGIKGN